MPSQTTEDVEVLYKKGERFYQFGEFDAAAEILQKALAVDESYAPAWNLLGLAHQMAGRTEAARESFDMAILKASEWTEPYEHLGMLEYSRGRFKDAIRVLKSYTKMGGENLDILLTLAEAAFKEVDCGTVLSVTSTILDINEDFYEVWEMRGICQAKKGKFNAACTSLNMALEINPEATDSINTVGDLCYESKNYTNAVTFYEMSLSADENQPHTLFRQGTSLWLIDRWKEAISLFERYVELVPDDPKGWNNLGVVLREKGEVKRAFECYHRALDLDPTLETTKNNLETAKNKQVIL